MKNLFTFFFFSLALTFASCDKGESAKPAGFGGGFTGDAKFVFESVWQYASTEGNHLVIDNESEFLNTNTGEIHAFTVETVTPVVGTDAGEGGGASFKGGDYEITIVRYLAGMEGQMRVRCFVDDAEVMSRWLYQ